MSRIFGKTVTLSAPVAESPPVMFTWAVSRTTPVEAGVQVWENVAVAPAPSEPEAEPKLVPPAAKATVALPPVGAVSVTVAVTTTAVPVTIVAGAVESETRSGEVLGSIVTVTAMELRWPAVSEALTKTKNVPAPLVTPVPTL
jgi:hypothetical protein